MTDNSGILEKKSSKTSPPQQVPKSSSSPPPPPETPDASQSEKQSTQLSTHLRESSQEATREYSDMAMLSSSELTVSEQKALIQRLGLTEATLKRFYETMIQVRAYDERGLKLQRSGRIGFCMISMGEEAAQIGTVAAFSDDDWLFPSYRQYGAAMYRGVSLATMAASLYGNANDLNKGRQMPKHYACAEKKFISFSSVIGTQIAHGVGCAIACKIRNDNAVVGTYFGDGGTSSNDFHSAMTFAGAMKAPMIFFCVNNQYAISLPVEKQCGAKSFADKGVGYGVHGVRVDGNDLLAVYAATKEAVDRARNGGGPTIVELLTYRAGPHSSSDDPTRYRSVDEQSAWESKDPIARFRKVLESIGLWTPDYENRVWEEARFRINQVTTEAEQIGEPAWETLFDDVYAELPPHLIEQKAELMQYEQGLNLSNQGEFPL